MLLLVELGFELLARAAGTGPLRAASLSHETLDYAVEHDAVVETFAHQFLDTRDMARREIERRQYEAAEDGGVKIVERVEFGPALNGILFASGILRRRRAVRIVLDQPTQIRFARVRGCRRRHIGYGRQHDNSDHQPKAH